MTTPPPPIRLLLIEDDPADARLVQMMLRRSTEAAFDVETAKRLSEATAMLAASRFDVMLADLSLPDSAGLSTLQALTTIAPDIPVVVLTGNDDDSQAIEALKRGAQDYLVKGRGDASMLTRVVRYAIERKGTERALTEARDRAEAAVRAKSLFLAMVGHEIRTPLNGILGMARLLSDTKLDQRQQTFTDTIVNSGELLLGLVNDILDFSRLEAEGLILNLEPLDLIDTIEELRLLMAPRAADKGLTMSCRFSSDLPIAVMGDPLRLRQVLMNLIGNAVKFTDKGNVLISAETIETVAAKEGTQTVRITVSDTGIGIPEDVRADLFTEFSQADPSITRRFGGAGLGLAICRRLVRLMGGEIGYESLPEKGSTFWFTVPFPIVPEDHLPTQAPTVSVLPCRVLLVDDNPVNRDVATGLMERHGHTVIAVEDGASAITMLEADGAFDLILLDMHMPGMDGIETARRMRALGGQAATTPAYLLTANPVEQADRQLREAGLDGCLAKPFRVEEVMRLLALPSAEIKQTRQTAMEPALVGLPDLLADLKDLGRDRMAGFVDLFRTTSGTDLAQAGELAAAGDLKALASVVHKMASAAWSLHLVALAERCRAIENAALADSPEAVTMADGLADLWERSLAALTDVVA